VPTSSAAAVEQSRYGLPGEALTRRAVTGITAAIVVMTFAFSLGNVTRLCLDLGITAWIAWLVARAVDLSVVGLLTGMRFLSLHGYTDAQLSRLYRMLRFCGLLTLALNTAGALGHRQYGTALVDAVGPALLIGWSEARPMDAAAGPRRLSASRPTGARRPSGARARASEAGTPGWAVSQGAPLGLRASRGNRQAYLPGQPPRPAANRPRPGQRPGRRRPRRGNRSSRTGAGKPGGVTSSAAEIPIQSPF
jgi:hypothetical protein